MAPHDLALRLRLPQLSDVRGELVIVEAEQHVPFQIHRVFFITNLKAGTTRGHHAHKACRIALFCIRGSTTVVLDDGSRRSEVRLDAPNEGLLIEPGIWHSMQEFSADALVLCFASEHYDEADYYREYDAFLASRRTEA